MPTPNILAWSGVIAAGTAVGTLLGFVLKEFLFPLTLDILKERRALQAVFLKYRDPILLSATELIDRLREILEFYPTEFLRSEIMQGNRPQRTYRAEVDPAYLRYKCESTMYRLCAFLGWLELYRQEVVFLRSGVRSLDQHLGATLRRIRSLLADGHLNRADDWENWKDALIMREEQRAVGEAMIVPGAQGREVMSYGQFAATKTSQTSNDLWVDAVGHFLFDLEEKRDFRRARLEYLTAALLDLVQHLSDGTLSARQQELRSTLQELPVNAEDA